MKLTEEDKRFVEAARRLESRKCRERLMFQAEAMYQAQEALKEDYGLAGPDAPLFNGAGGMPAA